MKLIQVTCMESAIVRCKALHDKAVNPSEIAKLYGGVPSSTRFQESVDEQRSEILYRTAPRVSLTCRVVTRVHKNLFKF
ncbi:hypothetical protein Leryth_016293 [Lithospermum erythrorhizon]|nr:hypothetical protein Leryth_016293 [Lithospermum erythrorhizon]